MVYTVKQVVLKHFTMLKETAFLGLFHWCVYSNLTYNVYSPLNFQNSLSTESFQGAETNSHAFSTVSCHFNNWDYAILTDHDHLDLLYYHSGTE